MSTPPEDIDALFDAPAEAPAPIESPAPPDAGLPQVGLDSRREQRFKVSWPARVQLPGGRVIDLRLRDLSENGVGLFTEVNIPPSTVLNFAMGVPDLNDPGRVTPVSGTIRTSYVVVQGRDMYCGGTWVSLPSDQRELLGKWIRKLRK